jgi:beta-lactamase superfamily II metal-dependent hydrolase
MVGANNTYGHPTQAALDRMKAAGVADSKILRTDLNGNIIFKVVGGALSVSADKGLSGQQPETKIVLNILFVFKYEI